jgi:hypothetical protein
MYRGRGGIELNPPERCYLRKQVTLKAQLNYKAVGRTELGKTHTDIGAV